MSVKNLQGFLDGARVTREVFELRPDYRVLLILIDGITPARSDIFSENLLREAEDSARATLAEKSVTEIPHVKAWQEAYKDFGAKPKKFRNSLEALTRRVDAGLPRVNRLTDIYNAVSVKYQIPIGGEDFDKYTSPPRCVRATGKEGFETTVNGQPTVEHSDVGEVVWCDDSGVTCRRWNWRQCTRTALTDDTKSALFVLDALEPIDDEALSAIGRKLISLIQDSNPNVEVVSRIIRANDQQV